MNARWYEKTLDEREKFKSTVKFVSSPLKISISEYVKSISSKKIAEDSEHYLELAELRKANIDGIITTNWDLLADSLFPDYKVFIGQEELLVSRPQNIGEIYKIHGCCTKPNSLILTDGDYDRFDQSNPYLAAKLVTLFVENPVIFMGYSLNDPNIKNVLSSIVKGIGPKNVPKITNNLIFVQREKDARTYGIRETVYALGDTDIPVTLLVTSDFSEIYRALQSVERKIPVRILRYCKEQMYELVSETSPSDQLCVVDFEDLDDSSNPEFVIGVGIIDRLSARGYQPLQIDDIFRDIVFDNGKFDPETLLSTTIQSFFKYSKYVPTLKYLRQLGITSKSEYDASKFAIRSIDQFEIKDYKNKQYNNFFLRECKGMGVFDIVLNYDPDKAALLIPFIPWKTINCDELILSSVQADADNPREACHARH